ATSSSASIRPVNVMVAPAARCSTVTVRTGRGCGVAVSDCGEQAESSIKSIKNVIEAVVACTARLATLAWSMHVNMAESSFIEQRHTAPQMDLRGPRSAMFRGRLVQSGPSDLLDLGPSCRPHTHTHTHTHTQRRANAGWSSYNDKGMNFRVRYERQNQ